MTLYRVIFLGLTVAGPEEEVRLTKGLQMKFNLSPAKAESLLQRVPIVVKKGASKEEMERYVKAFEEVGGRVRVEEEDEVTESPDISKGPAPLIEPDRVSYSGTTITCPQCGFKQPESVECIQCGSVILKYDRHPETGHFHEGEGRDISPGEECTPWENGEGFISAFLKTTGQVLFSPSEFFKKVSSEKGYWTSLTHAIICGIIGLGFSTLWERLFFSQLPLGKFFSTHYSPSYMILLVFGIPVFILFWSAVTHLCLWVVEGDKTGFATTFRVIAYSYSAYLFMMIPFIGIPISGVYIFVLTIIGVKQGQGISTRRAVAAVVFLPAELLFLLVMGATMLVALIFGSMKLLGGVRV